jgi:hypothetical protein
MAYSTLPPRSSNRITGFCVLPSFNDQSRLHLMSSDRSSERRCAPPSDPSASSVSASMQVFSPSGCPRPRTKLHLARRRVALSDDAPPILGYHPLKWPHVETRAWLPPFGGRATAEELHPPGRGVLTPARRPDHGSAEVSALSARARWLVPAQDQSLAGPQASGAVRNRRRS